MIAAICDTKSFTETLFLHTSSEGLSETQEGDRPCWLPYSMSQSAKFYLWATWVVVSNLSTTSAYHAFRIRMMLFQRHHDAVGGNDDENEGFERRPFDEHLGVADEEDVLVEDSAIANFSFSSFGMCFIFVCLVLIIAAVWLVFLFLFSNLMLILSSIIHLLPMFYRGMFRLLWWYLMHDIYHTQLL